MKLIANKSDVDRQAEQAVINQVNHMCMESLPPHLFNEWMKVRDFLMKVRKNLK